MINLFKKKYKNIYIPWNLDGYINGNHPLINSYLLFIKNKFNIIYPKENVTLKSVNISIKNKLIDFNSLRCIKSNDISSFIEYSSSRNNLADLYQPIDSVALHHSIMPSANFPSIMHFETPITFFIPFLYHGNFKPGFSLKDHFAYRFIYESLFSHNIKLIFTHSYLGYINFKQLFPDPLLHKKLRHVPADSFVNDFVVANRKCSIFRSREKHRINILFTSSYFSDEKTFWLRGGAITLKVFENICNKFPVTLNFVGKIPKDLPNEFKSILLNPNLITHNFLSDYDLQRLYDNSHILLSPTVGLHAMSLLRAKCSNLFVVSSNAPGVSDLINPGTDGAILECSSLQDIYFPDKCSTVLLDDYSLIKEFNYENISTFTQALIEILHTFKPNFSNNSLIDHNSYKSFFKEILNEALM